MISLKSMRYWKRYLKVQVFETFEMLQVIFKTEWFTKQNRNVLFKFRSVKMKKVNSEISRRRFIKQAGGSALAMAMGGAMTLIPVPAVGRKRLPSSKINGVEIGIILPYALRGLSGNPDAEQ